MGDVVMMHVYLAGDPDKGGQMDFAGMMAGYTQFFGTARSSPTNPHVRRCRLRRWLFPVSWSRLKPSRCVTAEYMPNQRG